MRAHANRRLDPHPGLVGRRLDRRLEIRAPVERPARVGCAHPAPTGRARTARNRFLDGLFVESRGWRQHGLRVAVTADVPRRVWEGSGPVGEVELLDTTARDVSARR